MRHNVLVTEVLSHAEWMRLRCRTRRETGMDMKHKSGMQIRGNFKPCESRSLHERCSLVFAGKESGYIFYIAMVFFFSSLLFLHSFIHFRKSGMYFSDGQRINETIFFFYYDGISGSAHTSAHTHTSLFKPYAL